MASGIGILGARGAALAVVGSAAVVAVFAATVGIAELLRGVDHGDELLGDFHGYYLPQGEVLRAGGGQIHGFFATPFVAALMAWLAGLGRDAATAVWAVVTIAALVAVVGLAGALTAIGATRTPARRAAAGWALPLLTGVAIALSVPLLHVARWGQVSGPSAALVLAAAVLVARPAAQGIALGAAIAFKPWAALALAAVGWRAGLVAGSTAVALLWAVPAPWLGIGGPPGFVFDVAADVAASERYLAVDPNSQSVVHAALRWLRVPAEHRGAWWPWLAPIGYVAAAGYLVWLRRARDRLGALAVPAALLALPCVTPTAWPSDLLLVIPSAAGALAVAHRSAGAHRVAPFAVGAVVLLSWPLQQACGGHRWHGALALPLVAVVSAAIAIHGTAGRAATEP